MSINKLDLYKKRKWQRQRNDNDAYLEDINPVIEKVNDLVDYANTAAATDLYQGTLDASGGIDYPAATIDQYWRISADGTIGTQVVEAGDMVICIADYAGGVDDTKFIIVEKNISDISDLTDTEQLLDKMLSVTRSELKALRDASELIAGQEYRITDYEFTTTQANTQSAGNVFDIIVTADSVNTLNENARAVQHAGDTYFNDANLAAWQLKYSLDNDDTKFAWADTVTGKGVIWQMIDEWNNDLPYDFKNAQFTRKITDGAYDPAGTDTWCYTFTWFGELGDAQDLSIVGNSLQNDEGTYSGMHDNKIESCSGYALGLTSVFVLGDNVIYASFAYDSGFFYGLHSNTIGNSFNSNTIGDNFNSNAIGDYFYSNTIGNEFYYNTIGDNFNSNTIGSRFLANTIGNEFYYNTIGDNFNYNTIGNYFNSNAIGDYFYYNTIGNYFYSNTIGNEFYYNTIGNNLYKTIFGDNCKYNTIANKINGTTTSKIITFGNNITMCTIQDFAFGILAADLDLSAATILPGAYNKTIYYDKTHGVKLRYFDAGSIVIADVTD